MEEHNRVIEDRPVLAACAAAVLGILLVDSLVHLGALRDVLDDAYMFVRYADHLLKYGCLCWNVPGPRTYGLTAPAYLAVVVPVRLMAASSPRLTVMLSSSLSGVLWFALLYRLMKRHALPAGDAGTVVGLLVLSM